MAESVVQTFLSAQPERRLELARDPANAGELEAYLGKALFGEYAKLAANAKPAGRGHLSAAAPESLLFVPGVMGSHLFSQRRGGTFWLDVLNVKKVDELRLAAGGRADHDPLLGIAPFTTDFVYEPFNIEVQKSPAFALELHPYDWRKPIAESATTLRERVEDLASSRAGPVHLVAHSMGGLVVRAALKAHPDLWQKIGKIAFIGTPHYGAPAIASYLKNHLWGFEQLALLGRYLSRETFRSLRGVLHLLPAPAGVYPGTRAGGPHLVSNFDLYEVGGWNLGLDAEESKELQSALDEVATFHRELSDWHDNELTQSERNRMLVIAGIGFKTLFRMEIEPGFFRAENVDKVTKRKACEPDREGDGRVPLASATLRNVQIRFVKGVHGALTNLPGVAASVFAWLEGRPHAIGLPSRCEIALSRHLAGGVTTSPLSRFDGSARAVGDDPGLWNLPPSPASLDQLEAELLGGKLGEFASVRLL